MNINKIICTGRLTKDPELHKISEEMSVCQLRLAVDGMDGAREAGFINVAVFGKAGEACAEYLAKGWLVAVDGRLEYGEWETEGGEKRHDYSVVGKVEFLTAPRPAEPQAEEPAKPARRKRRVRSSVMFPYPETMDEPQEIELVFAPEEQGGYHVYAPDLPGLHTQGDTLEEATANAQEALELYVEGLREDGRPLDTGVIRRRFPVPA
jgi:single-strand DNA-binding protein